IHSARLDLDVFDLTSHHFALFERSEGIERVVGTVRVTTDRPGPMAAVLHQIACGNEALEAQLATPRPTWLPMFSHLPADSGVVEAVERAVSDDRFVAEAGRLTIDPALRMSAGRRCLRI